MTICIQAINIEDFRAFQGINVIRFNADPRQHIDVITGPRASGKSTLVEALQLCTYGQSQQEGSHQYVTEQVFDDLEEGETASAEITVDVIDTRNSEKTYRISREVSSLKEPDGPKDIVSEPIIEERNSGGSWSTVGNPVELLASLFPKETLPFSFFSPVELTGFEAEDGVSFSHLVEQIQSLNQESGEPVSGNLARQYVDKLGERMSLDRRQYEPRLSEGELAFERPDGVPAAISAGGRQIISFSLTMAAGEFEGVDTPLVFEVPFLRVDPELRETMLDLIRRSKDRQIILICHTMSLKKVVNEITEVIGSFHRLGVDESGLTDIEERLSHEEMRDGKNVDLRDAE